MDRTKTSSRLGRAGWCLGSRRAAWAWACASSLIGVCAQAQQAPKVELEGPRSGWRLHSSESASFMQAVNYPANSVNTSNAAIGSLIRGRVLGAAKGPARLIVNGLAMPQRIEDDGSFARPYAFSSGSNSIEVRSSDGAARLRRQFYAQPAGAISPRLRVMLAWDTDQTDLDLHVISPDGQHAWYGERSLPNGGGIDTDVTTGYGPEIYANPSPPPGLWLVYVNFYGGRASSEEGLTIASLSILSNEGTRDEKQETFRIPMREAGETVLVKRFAYP